MRILGRLCKDRQPGLDDPNFWERRRELEGSCPVTGEGADCEFDGIKESIARAGDSLERSNDSGLNSRVLKAKSGENDGSYARVVP
jgi:hypothetical protein